MSSSPMKAQWSIRYLPKRSGEAPGLRLIVTVFLVFLEQALSSAVMRSMVSITPIRTHNLAGESGSTRVAGVLRLVPIPVRALRVRTTICREIGHDGHRVSAHAEGRRLQPRCGKRKNRGCHEGPTVVAEV